MTDSERIRALKEFLGKSYNRIAEECGLKNVQTLYDIKNGKHGISKDVADLITGKYLNISKSWLLAGEGEMLRQSTNEGDRNINNVSHGSAATLGNQSPVYKDVKIGKDDCANQEVEELRKLLAEAQNRISNLEGRIEEKESFIQKLLAR